VTVRARPGSDESGAVFVEYLEILILVTIGMAAATIPLGIMLVRYWDVIDTLIGLPFP